MAPPVVCLSSDYGRGPLLLHVKDPLFVPYVRERFEAAGNGSELIVGHNLAYDVSVLMAHDRDLVPIVFAAYASGNVSDTMIRQKLLDIAEGCYRGYTSASTGKFTPHKYSLDDLSRRHLGVQLDKDVDGWRMRYWDLINVPVSDWPGRAVDYAEGDATATLGVWNAQQRCVERDPNVLVDEPRQLRAALALHLASVWGIRTDAAGVEKLRRNAEADIASVREFLIKEGLLKRSGQRMIKAAQRRMAEVSPDGKKTEKGGVCVDEEACKDSGDPALIALSKYGKAQNIISKDVKALEQGTTLPIHTRFDSLMETGRTSSGGVYNLQNPRRLAGVRECFVPREGKVFASCDYDKAELHSLSQVCLRSVGKSRLAERLNAGFDPHLDLGAQLLGITYEEALRLKKDARVKNARQQSKAANFGLPGGMGPKGFQAYSKAQYDMDFTIDFCKKLKENWLQNWPEMEEYFDWVRNLCGEAGVATITHFFSCRRRGLVPYTVACNSFFQGLAADGAKAAMWEVCRRQHTDRGSALWGTRTVNFIHDELIVEVPEDRAHDAAVELQETMIEVFNRWVPDVPVRASAALMRRWSKEAEPVHKNGKLIPWEDREVADAS